MNTSGRLYKIRLTSGRIIGPIDFHRVQLLILKNHITGAEVGRIYPQGDWVDVNLISEIAETFILKISGKLEKILKDELTDVGFQTQINQVTKLLTEAQNAIQIPEGTLTEVEAPEDADLGKITPEKMPIQPILPVRPIWDETQTTGSKTFFDIKDEEKENITLTQLQIAPENLPEVKKISDEKTIVFQKQSKPFFSKTMTKQKTNKFFIYLLFGAGVFLFVEDLIRKETPTPIINKPRIIRPILPHFAQSKPDPLQSEQIYNQTLKDYLEDTVEGYKSAADKLLKAVELDPENVKALALLASSYLNLIDSSNKEENYFKVISTLIDMSRVKAADLQETVIADVEFFVNVHQPEAAQNRKIEYVKTHKTYDLILFYYISYSAFHRGDLHGAVNYLSKIPDTNVFSSKVFYLRGLIYEKFGNFDDAFLEYQKAIRLNKNHAKSYLKIAELLWNNGKIQSAQKYIEFVIQHANFLSPKDLAKGYYLSAIFYEQLNNWNYALASIEKAVFFESDNADYLLEIYTLRARAGESIKAIQQEARMYYFLGEGQKLLKQGQYHEALTFFLRARESNLDSAMPLIKIGDLFFYLNDIANARLNYELATRKASNNIEVWSKYIQVLIQSYEWDEAKKAMDRFRVLPVSQSTIDKAAGDMYAKQSRYEEAQTFYKRAMSRDTIDPAVYIAYAQSLYADKKYKEAPFFYSIALRYDPLNVDALIGTAKCIAASEGIDRAIQMLRDELQKGSTARAEFLGAIAEFQIQKGEWEFAQKYIDQAIEANPDYAYPWKLQAQIYLNREGRDKQAVDKALAAFKSYSDRNTSDPVGYIERYRLFIRKALFEKAEEELEKIYAIFPKYPNLHFYKGYLYATQGNYKIAIEEFKTELKNSPTNVTTMIALGKAYLEQGSLEDALTQFNKAMQLASRAVEPKHMAAYTNHLLKNYQSAIVLYRAALQLDAANPMLHKRLGLAYWDMGDPTSARAEFKHYLEMEPDAQDRSEVEKFF